MELSLNLWRTAWFGFLLDPATGLRRIRFLGRRMGAGLVHGFSACEPAFGVFWRFYAVYGNDGRFIFQVGRKRWDLTDGIVHVSCKFVLCGFASRVSVVHDGDLIHQALLVHPLRALSSVLDPAFDEADIGEQHFFYFLKNVMSDSNWRAYVVSLSAAA